ncbi:MBL fold metallo-hydrolase [Desulfosarcina sp.]|uniref:MBL fold metallo-hydrolase n=1 Tax=Desulfosarcina sp. TaxID=2027861 RepID=UPI0029B1C184|nr:MBL fold metallo-hydrolase [Desulfosarcina sp.]MDX2453612.1 MBL fold metallo-hydrolase [Desulfosarcina sp.]MDX2491319.1 MBL fold metallo-hydrolase [Desulfosarcina sp.]
MAATVHHFGPHLFLIVLTPPISGFQDFIGAWLVVGPEAVYLVDVGPAATADPLIDAITALGVDRLDYICLTHIHIDHAGAVGHLVRQFPGTQVVCHPKGIPHIVDPERLWQGTVKTLGDTGRAYGHMLPVDPSLIATESQLASAPFQLLDTPGHSPHHYAISANGCLFAGEAGGVCLPLSSGDIYLRPATPPRFFLETSLSSIDRLMSTRPETLCYGHFGMREDGMRMLERHRKQLLFWEKRLAAEAAGGGMESADFDNRWVDLLLAEDPLLHGFSQLAQEVQVRERSFLRNSVRGFAGYLASREENSISNFEC